MLAVGHNFAMGVSGDLGLLSNPLTDLIVRYRKWLFAFVALLQVISFNGRWRLGLDTAEYRGLALGLASGKGYTFNDWASHQVYPGLPFLLASVEYTLGPADRTPSKHEQQRLLGPSLVTTTSVGIITLMALLVIWLTYKLVGLHYPQWVATMVALCVGVNSVFLQHSHELLTDVPFLCGVLLALLGWEYLQRAENKGATSKACGLIVIGLVLAASMRPTFWILALCWLAACGWKLIRGPRKPAIIALGMLVVLWAMMVAIDPRFKGFNPLAGGYEREALEILPSRLAKIGPQVYRALHDQFPPSVFGESMAPVSILTSVVLLGCAGFLVRRHLLWALLIWLTFAVTLAISTVPRYYMMVLPLLLVGWFSGVAWVARRVPGKWGTVVLGVGLGLVVLNNVSASVKFIIEQRQPNFMKHYRRGDFANTLRWASLIRKHVKPGQKMLAPSASILSVLTGAHVYTQKELFPRGPSHLSPRILAAAKIRSAVFPARLYHDKSPMITKLIKRGVIRRQHMVVHGPHKTVLSSIRVVVPQGDWRKLPTYHDPTTKPAKKHHAVKPSSR